MGSRLEASTPAAGGAEGSQPASAFSVNISKPGAGSASCWMSVGDPKQTTPWQDFGALRSAWLWGHSYGSHIHGVRPQPQEAGRRVPVRDEGADT